MPETGKQVSNSLFLGKRIILQSLLASTWLTDFYTNVFPFRDFL